MKKQENSRTKANDIKRTKAEIYESLYDGE
jgi:hypothetical protein